MKWKIIKWWNEIMTRNEKKWKCQWPIIWRNNERKWHEKRKMKNENEGEMIMTIMINEKKW